ncbi:glycogen synthase GlgA [Pollutimonas bauzanensis]|uniref:glycogen synthase GlgA n=1 Tax=Pollutimonas bauzanensis TaxID=658167 RepID=UPI00333EDD29
MTLRVLAVTSEAFPLAKTGGLGDAVSGLALAIKQSGIHVTLLLPAYPSTLAHVIRKTEVATLTGLPGGDATLLGAYCPELGLDVLLLRNAALYDRDGYYVAADGSEYPDNAMRYAALAHAAARIAQGVERVQRPHIVHAHDWHAALTPLLMHQMQVQDVKTVLTLHNVAFQGVFPIDLADSLGISEPYRTGDGMEFWGQLNFLKAGIRYADLITVVSRNYAREILTPQFGCGLEGALAARGGDLISIPNGIDTTLWNPLADPYLRGRAFSADHLSNKALCKRDLQHAMGLNEDPHAVVMGMGSRLTTQKMADLAAEAIPASLDAHPSLQVCVLGQGDHKLEAALLAIGQRYPGRCSVYIGFDERRAHLLHAGADILLHGSRFEPFGLTPLYSMRYGTIPVASRVGGMVDTITDPGKNLPAGAMRGATGVLFEGEQPQDMVHAIDRALALHADPDLWHAMQVNGMRSDFSWAKTAPAYLSAYQALRPDVALDRVPERRRGLALVRSGQGAVIPASAGTLPGRLGAKTGKVPRPEAPGLSSVVRHRPYSA